MLLTFYGTHYVINAVIYNMDFKSHANQTRLKQLIVINHATATEIVNDIDKVVIDDAPFGGCGVVGPEKRF